MDRILSILFEQIRRRDFNNAVATMDGFEAILDARRTMGGASASMVVMMETTSPGCWHRLFLFWRGYCEYNRQRIPAAKQSFEELLSDFREFPGNDFVPVCFLYDQWTARRYLEICWEHEEKMAEES